MVTNASSPPQMRQETVLGWLAQVLAGVALIGAGIEIEFIFSAGGWSVLAGCTLLCLLGLAVLARAEWLERPQRVLRKARRTLNFPTQWSVKFNKRIVQGGVVPVAVIRADGVRFVIDIKACKSVTWGTPTDGSGEPPLVGPNGKRLKPDPVPPLLQAALAASAAPVLWLPQAEVAKNLRHPESNLIVVMGTARDLKHALQGAEIVPIRRAPKKHAGSKPGKDQALSESELAS